MDCMNAHGKLISVEDIRDMKGVCWVYIRVAIHGISLKTTTSNVLTNTSTTNTVPLGSVVVGDTFLFSACSIAARRRDVDLPAVESVPNAPYTLISDAYCMTHAIPYYRCLISSSIENNSIRHFLACLRLPYT